MHLSLDLQEEIILPFLFFWIYERHNSGKFKKLEKKLLEGISVQEEIGKNAEFEIVPVEKEQPKQDVIQYPPVMSAKYLLIGGGTATAAAMESIYEQEKNADIIIVTADEFSPYMRPPLSKELWSTDSKSANSFIFSDWQGNSKTFGACIFYRNDDFFETHDISSYIPGKVRLLKKRRGIKLDVDSRTLTLDNGTVIRFQKVLLATGGIPKVPKFAENFDKKLVSTFRSANDFLDLRNIVESGKDVTIYGGGFLGSELSVALNSAKYGGKVTQIIPEDGNISQVFPKYLSKWTSQKLEKMGIRILRSSKIEKIQKSNEALSLKLESGEILTTDHLVIAVGISPDVELAKLSGLEIDEIRGGIVTNAELEARSNVFAAGDVISFHDVVLGRRRVEHHDHAVLSGITAGSNMIGKKKPYKHQSMYWSDLGPSISIEAVGITDSALSTVGIWTQPESFSQQVQNTNSDNFVLEEKTKGLIFYLKEQKIVGILMLNVPNKIHEAKKLLLEGKKSSEIPNILDRFQLYSE